ncbi:hypothetical protein CDAR_462921 [Caerostris darwini]|uniref:Uncharacterized protein n=1 Tax=Caerostris darwini TaxID=1538125 RepID=A0AAV4QAN4_9ARAC|nr:hypothetical protein CDAR_462921 [Caerostris darwini]
MNGNSNNTSTCINWQNWRLLPNDNIEAREERKLDFINPVEKMPTCYDKESKTPFLITTLPSLLLFWHFEASVSTTNCRELCVTLNDGEQVKEKKGACCE